jgi:SAM-dependent methyltransferase
VPAAELPGHRAGSDRLVDALVAWGDLDAIGPRVDVAAVPRVVGGSRVRFAARSIDIVATEPASPETTARRSRRGSWHDRTVVLFERVVSEYDAARPGYPARVFDALGLIDEAVVLEGGAGTGIATRSLLDRGARVVPFDLGPDILRRAVIRSPGLGAVVADGATLPFRDRCADLVCFAQSWHWLAPDRRCQEAARVLRSTGRWAGWWSHARADDEEWFDTYWSAIEAGRPGTHRDQRDIDWGEDLQRSGLFATTEKVTVPWVRDAPVDVWLTDLSSHSYIAALSTVDRVRLLGIVEGIFRAAFPSGVMQVRYETWLWIARPLS